MKTVAALIFAVALLLMPAAALAAPAGTTHHVGKAPLTDHNANRISDGLDAAMATAAPNDRFDVVVNTRVAHPAAWARAQVGDFPVYEQWTIIHGFHGSMTKAQIQGLAHSADVKRIEENFSVKALDESQNDFGTAAARAQFPVTGAGVGFCMTDTGADPNHEQLDGSKIAGWHDFVNGRTTPYDDYGHGTHVLSTAVGDGTGGSLAVRFEGVAPASPAYVAKVLDSSGSGTDAQVISGVQWCAGIAAVRVISMSIGSDSASDGQDAISQAVETAILTNGKVAVVAAGNAGDDTATINSPGAAQDAITVGSVAKYSAPSGYHTDGIYLSSFSSRGPTLDGRTKPDVVSPGERTVAAEAGTAATYVEMTGTSMATPFVAGTVALALQANPALTPAQVKSIVMGTAQDRGAAGVDNDWGAGLIDGYAVVARAEGVSSYQPTAFPTDENVTANVPNNGEWRYQFSVGSGDLGIPIAVTILINGSAQCVSGGGGFCFQYAWSPDLDAELLGPDGSSVAQSTCPLNCDYTSVGHQETLALTPTQAGTYTVRVYSFSGGGTIHMDVSHGPVGSTSPPANHAPVASNDAYSVVSGNTLSVPAPGVLGNDTDADGDALTAAVQGGPAHGTLTLNANGSLTYTPASGYTGSDSFTYTASDGQASSNIATVSITVQAPPPPTNVHIGDIDGTTSVTKTAWKATVTVTVHDQNEAAVSGATVYFSWSDGTTGSCTTKRGGTCSASKTLKKTVTSITFTVTNVAAASPYNASLNHDPDGSSNGTTITVTKP